MDLTNELLLCTCTLVLLGATLKLPESVIPKHYKIQLLIDPENSIFKGSTKILMKCSEETSKIILHARWLNIQTESLRVKRIGKPNETLDIESVVIQEAKDFLIINLKTMLERNQEYLTDLNFEGRPSEDAWGLYHGNFSDAKGEMHRYWATHFEPTYARQAFPCFDEPAFKSSFEIIIGRQQKYEALSNMPLIKSEPMADKEDWFWDYFGQTPNMSTYIVAFAVLDGYTKITNGALSIWSTQDTVHWLELALQETPKYFQYFEDLFLEKYDMPKMDFICLNKYPFWSSAMENWGLNTYTGALLLHKGGNEISSVPAMGTIAHELAHQWFGNLVTMKCWGQCWLKESFATYFSLLARDFIIENGLFEIGFIQNHINIILYNGSRSLNTECTWDHDSALLLFDSTTYARGGPILRMTQYFLGLHSLGPTMNYVLVKYAHSNFDSGNLIDAFEATAELKDFPTNISLNDVMATWLDRPGFPVVEVERKPESKTATLRQKSLYGHFGDTICWWIPITFTSENDLNERDFKTKVWMSCPRKETVIEGFDPSAWILLNVQMSGLYMVKYDENSWMMLSKTLRQRESFELIPPINRFQLVFDRLTLAFHGEVSYDSLLQTLLYLKHENKFIPWKPAVDFLKKLKMWLYDEQELVAMFVRNLTQPHFNKRIFKANNPIAIRETYFNVLIAETSCEFQLTDCLNEMYQLFDKYKGVSLEENPIPKEFRFMVYCSVLKRGKNDDIKIFRSKFEHLKLQSYKDPNEYKIMESSMNCIKTNQEIHERSIIYLDSDVELNSFPLDYDKKVMYERMEKDHKHIVSKWLANFADQLYREEDLKEFRENVRKNEQKLILLQETVEESIRRIKRNINWRKLYAENVKQILRKILNVTTENLPSKVRVPQAVFSNSYKFQAAFSISPFLFSGLNSVFSNKLILNH